MIVISTDGRNAQLAFPLEQLKFFHTAVGLLSTDQLKAACEIVKKDGFKFDQEDAHGMAREFVVTTRRLCQSLILTDATCPNCGTEHTEEEKKPSVQ